MEGIAIMKEEPKIASLIKFDARILRIFTFRQYCGLALTTSRQIYRYEQ